MSSLTYQGIEVLSGMLAKVEHPWSYVRDRLRDSHGRAIGDMRYVDNKDNVDLIVEAINALPELIELAKRTAELDALFDLQWKRMGEATKAWQEAHPGKDDVWPDLGDLLTWLLEERNNWRERAEGGDGMEGEYA